MISYSGSRKRKMQGREEGGRGRYNVGERGREGEREREGGGRERESTVHTSKKCLC